MFASHQTPETRATTLHEALELVTGPVCTDPSTAARCWSWIDLEQWIRHTESAVGRLACDLSGLCLRLKEADSAAWAARRGIEITGQREDSSSSWSRPTSSPATSPQPAPHS